MCGRYVIAYGPEMLVHGFSATRVVPFPQRFNVAPQSPVPVVYESREGERVAALGLRCAFSEPQMNAGLLRTVAEGSGLQLVEIDALGVALEPGPDLYPELLRRMADAVAGCLAR